MAQHILTTGQVNALQNALKLAAEQYDKDSKDFAAVGASIRDGTNHPMFAPGEAGAVAADRLEVQFGRQAREARDLLTLLEESTDVIVRA